MMRLDPAARSAPAKTYDRTTVLLHWASVVIVLTLWITAQLIDYFPRGPARYPMRSTHILLGVAFGTVLGFRLWWRATRGRSLDNPGSPLARTASQATHVLLYLLLIAAVVLGVGNAWVRGDHIYTWFQIPALSPGNPSLKKTVGGLHEWCGHLILAVAALHASAALIHHYVLRDGRLLRMTFKTP